MYIQIVDDQIIAKADWQFPGSVYTERDIVTAWDGKFYFAGEEPEFVDDRTYEEKRSADYPPIEDYLDAQVKINSGNEELVRAGEQQLQDYYTACLNVKNTYPKE